MSHTYVLYIFLLFSNLESDINIGNIESQIPKKTVSAASSLSQVTNLREVCAKYARLYTVYCSLPEFVTSAYVATPLRSAASGTKTTSLNKYMSSRLLLLC